MKKIRKTSLTVPCIACKASLLGKIFFIYVRFVSLDFLFGKRKAYFPKNEFLFIYLFIFNECDCREQNKSELDL